MDALAEIRVLDLTDGIAGPLCTMWLADFGADVVKVERPAGDPARARAGFAMWNRGKRGVTADPENSAHRSWVTTMAAGADVVVVNNRRQLIDFGLHPDAMSAENPGLVLVQMPPYLDGMTPWAGGAESAALLAAAVGQLARQASYSGDPVDLVYPTALYAQGVWAAACTVATLVEREKSGYGQLLTVSAVNGAQALIAAVLNIEADSADPDTAVGPGGRHPTYGRLLASDGQWFGCGALGEKFELAALRAFDLEWMLDEPRMAGSARNLVAPDNVEWAQGLVAAAAATRTREEWLTLLAENSVPCGPLSDRREWLDHPQMRAVGMTVEIEDPERGTVRMPGIPLWLSDTPGQVGGPAPGRGGSIEDVVPWPRREDRVSGRPPIRPGPLHDIVVLDTGTFVAAPYTGGLLAELGASVVKVEPPTGDPSRVICYPFNRGMRSLAIDLSAIEGRTAFHRLVKNADVVISGLRPGAAERLSIDPATLSAVNPALVTLTLTAYGPCGPLSHRTGVDMVIQAMSGTMKAQGGSDEPVANTVAMIDTTTAAISTLGIVLALFNRARSGRAQHVQTALAATAAYIQCGELTDFAAAPASPLGSRDHKGNGPLDRLYRASDGWIRVQLDPHRVEPTVGRLVLGRRIDELVALDESTWRQLVADRTVSELDAEFRAAGIPAAVVRTITQAVRNPDLVRSDYVECYPATAGGFILVAGRLASFSRTVRSGLLLPPGIGEHTRSILQSAGVSDDDIDRLVVDGVVHDGAPMTHSLSAAYR